MKKINFLSVVCLYNQWTALFINRIILRLFEFAKTQTQTLSIRVFAFANPQRFSIKW
jgi:hypothetical protein